jgi:hypothetical protein
MIINYYTLSLRSLVLVNQLQGKKDVCSQFLEQDRLSPGYRKLWCNYPNVRCMIMAVFNVESRPYQWSRLTHFPSGRTLTSVCLIFIYKSEILDHDLRDSSTTLRLLNHITVAKATFEQFEKKFHVYDGAFIWNSLPENLWESKTLSIFERKIATHELHRAFKTC